VAWNRDRGGDPAVKLSALQWSISGMSDTADRLASVNASDRPQALALLVEAVWSVTIVDAALVRYHAGTYDAVMADQTPVERRLMEETLAGLASSGIGSATKSILISSSNQVHTDPAQTKGL
jgi:hypothetical protein